jgi:hypothetical protein
VLTPTALGRLTARPSVSPGGDIDWDTPIDRTRWYLCETLTPLYYTTVYRELATEHRRRYNQLSGILTSEVIALFETELLRAALQAVESLDDHDQELCAAVASFRDDEQRHARIWEQLNRLSEPQWYTTAARHLIQMPWHAAVLSRFLARHPVAFPVVFWMQIVQEERSVEFSRRCMRMPRERIEPRYAAAYAAHIQDEVRHVQIDRHLIERFYAHRTRTVRRITARLFRWIIGSLLLTPVNSSARVVKTLASEHPELTPLVPRMLRELRNLSRNDDYHEMMYSRRTTPVTFTLFDRFVEFRQMRHVLRAYRPINGNGERLN